MRTSIKIVLPSQSKLLLLLIEITDIITQMQKKPAIIEIVISDANIQETEEERTVLNSNSCFTCSLQLGFQERIPLWNMLY
jgi:hypothetical protein